NRVERDVPDQLQPDLVAESLLDRRLQPAGGERLRDPEAALAAAAVRLADREPRSLDVLHDAGRDELGGAVDDAADRARGGDRVLDRAARVDGLEPRPLERAALGVEVPPGDPV